MLIRREAPLHAADRAPSGRVVWVNAALASGVLLGYAALIWNRRWISDDGLIVLRTVRQLLAGNGPVFNVGERVEANTSTLWTYLLALPGLVPGVSLNWAAVVAGLLLAVAGVGLAMDAVRRLFGPGRLLVPCGAVAVAVLPPFWDFGTSGLETGMVFGWLGLTWWLLVRRLTDATPRRAWAAALVVGLAPLVRPDLVLTALVVAVALVFVERMRGRRLLVPALVGLAVPVAYEVFRAGYYGLLVPGTAVAKEAGVARWEQGGHYLADLVDTYALGWPLALAAVALVVLLVRFRRAARPAVVAVVAAPVVAGLLMGLYVVQVGGDFMHGRMLLPALFCLLMPAAAVPLTRWTAVPVLGVAVWAAACLTTLRPAYEAELGSHFIANERMYYVSIVQRAHPVVAEDFLLHPGAPDGVAALAGDPGPALALLGPGHRWWLLPTAGADTIVWLNIGVAGALAPLETRVLDGVGLASPLAAHTPPLPAGRIGHDKTLPPEWLVALYGATDTGWMSPGRVDAARVALTCPGTAELLDSYRAPLTLERFWDNLVGAPARTAYRFDRNPLVAMRCGA